jgi:hypothetical protein
MEIRVFDKTGTAAGSYRRTAKPDMAYKIF